MARRRPGSRSWSGWLTAAVLILFMALVIYRSLHLGSVSCEVCITYRGLSQCRTVEGPNEEEARSAATNNVCAHISSGITDSIACSRTPPTRSECVTAE